MFNKTKELLQLLKLPTNPQTIRTLDSAFGEGGCNDFTLTVEALAFVTPNPGSPGSDNLGVITSAANQEYLYKEKEELVTLILPWIALPESSNEDNGGFLPALNIIIDRSCCQDAIQISLVGEDIQDLAEYVPLDFEVPEGESAIMIPLVFSSEASLGPKIIGVQAIGCGQNKIKDLYFEYINPFAFQCPTAAPGYISIYNSTGNPKDGCTVTLAIYVEVAGDYQIIFDIEGEISPITLSGYINGWSNIEIPFEYPWTSETAAAITVQFTPYEFQGIECGTYCETFTYIGYVSYNFTLTENACSKPEPYYGMAAIGEDMLLKGLKQNSNDSNYASTSDPSTALKIG